MDLLSRLLSLVPVTGALDVRCHFGAPWRLEKREGAHHEIAYHVLLSGHAVVDDGHGTPCPLLPGDIVLFPGGGAHSLHDGSGRKPKPTRHRQAEHLTIAENKGSGEPADVLCGRFFLGTGSTRLLRDYMPGQLVVHSAAQADAGGIDGAEDVASTRLARLIQLMREEAADERPGSASLVNHFSAALFALTLRFASQAAEAPAACSRWPSARGCSRRSPRCSTPPRRPGIFRTSPRSATCHAPPSRVISRMRSAGARRRC